MGVGGGSNAPYPASSASPLGASLGPLAPCCSWPQDVREQRAAVLSQTCPAVPAAGPWVSPAPASSRELGFKTQGGFFFFFANARYLFRISHKNKLRFYRKLWVETFLKKSVYCIRSIGPDPPWGVALAPGRGHSNATVCVRAGEGTGLCRRSRLGAGTSYQDKTRWHLAGTEYLMGLVAHFWDSTGGRPKGVKLSMGASERMSPTPPKTYCYGRRGFLSGRKALPPWRRAVPAAQRCREGECGAQEPLRTRQRRAWTWPCTGSQASASPSTVMMPAATRGSRRNARTGT